MLPLLAIALSLPAPQAAPSNLLGSALYRNCKADVRMMDSPTGGENADIDPANACIEYVSGFVDAFAVTHQICPPESASRGTIIRIYVAYMDKYPKLFDEDRAMGLWGALITAYPCATK
jgi:hypothetical protein